jgi:hypothetical protein
MGEPRSIPPARHWMTCFARTEGSCRTHQTTGPRVPDRGSVAQRGLEPPRTPRGLVVGAVPEWGMACGRSGRGTDPVREQALLQTSPLLPLTAAWRFQGVRVWKKGNPLIFPPLILSCSWRQQGGPVRRRRIDSPARAGVIVRINLPVCVQVAPLPSPLPQFKARRLPPFRPFGDCGTWNRGRGILRGKGGPAALLAGAGSSAGKPLDAATLMTTLSHDRGLSVTARYRPSKASGTRCLVNRAPVVSAA